jgi:hypothetical protein
MFQNELALEQNRTFMGLFRLEDSSTLFYVHTVHIVFPGGRKRPGRDVDPSPHSSPEV